MPTTKQHAPLVWYAGYGSNLSRGRFMPYISGGTPAGSDRAYEGCRDHSEPRDDKPIRLDHQLYFADYSARWGGAIAFIRKAEGKHETLGRMYLVTDDQFNDIVRQENGRRPNGSRICPPFQEIVQGECWSLPNIRLYGSLLKLGNDHGHPVLTFTATREDFQINPPSEPYVKLLAAGLKETYPDMSDKEVRNYLLRADGIRGVLSVDQVSAWVEE